MDDARTTAAVLTLAEYIRQNRVTLTRRKDAVMDALEGCHPFELVPIIGFLMAQCDARGLDTQLIISCLQQAQRDRDGAQLPAAAQA